MWSNEPCFSFTVLCYQVLLPGTSTTALMSQLVLDFCSSSLFAAVLVGELLQQHCLQSAQPSFDGLALSNKLELVSPRGLRHMVKNKKTPPELVVEHARGRTMTLSEVGNNNFETGGRMCMCIRVGVVFC